MSRKDKKGRKFSGGGLLSPKNGFEGMSFEELRQLALTAPIVLQNRLSESLNSQNFDEVMKAQAFMQLHQSNKVKADIKSILWNPSELGFSGRGYKDPNNGVSFSTLNRMGEIFIVKTIINTRVEQVQNFLKYSVDDQKPGYQIRYKKSLFESERKEIQDKDRGVIETIVNFLENGGENDKWSCEDNFQEFTRKVIRDSLVLDQMSFEIVRSRDMKLNKYRAVDASLIRILEANDPRYGGMFEEYRWHGHLPRFAMVWDGQIIRNPVNDEHVIFYPWELGFGVRNKSTNVMRNGYGCSELETLIEIVTWVLWGMQYNGNFFKQGSQPKGFINVKNGNIDQSTLNEFRQDWQQTMSSVHNAHKVPVIQGIDLEWIDLQQTNKDMEFTEWIKFLLVVTCAVYRIDPSELGFQFQDASSIFGQDGQKERLDHSKQKGLIPLLIFYQNILNKYIISEIDDRFELVFTGIEIENEEAQVDLDKKKVDSGFVSAEDMFEKYSGRKLDPDKDTILNHVYQTALSNKMMGGGDMNEVADEQGGVEGEETSGAPQTADEAIQQMLLEKSRSNPILGKALEFIDSQLGIKK